MAIFFFLLLLLPHFSATAAASTASAPSPFLSATTLFQNYKNMLKTFKVFIYTPTKPFNFPDVPASIFHDSLLRSPFLTHNPNEAHFFFIPFSPNTSTRALARVVKELRTSYPYWNRSLGADHFFFSPTGIELSSDRNVLELKKNSVQISFFPVTSGNFIPHKDITLPPFFQPLQEKHTSSSTKPFLAYLKWDGKTESKLVNEMKQLNEFSVFEKSEPLDYVQSVRNSKFCLFFYHGEVARLAEVMSHGCVPVVIVDRPIQDLPLMDVLRWSDMALLVMMERGGSGARRLKEVLMKEEKYQEMRKLAVAASKHLVWNVEEAQPLDAFHLVMYQLWLRRHVIRYERREFGSY